MFSKPIFKQCVRSNGKLWAIFTAVACAMLYFMMSSFDAGAFSSIASATEGTRFENLASNFGSFLGLMETFYRMLPILLGMVYAILATSNLIVSEVDSGSMAYTLSTPTKRSTVVLTKMAYMVGSVVLMFVVLCGAGLGFAELTQHCITDSAITADVQAAAEAMDRKPSYVRDHLYMIQDDKYALESGAQERGMDTEAYSLYLDQAMLRDSYKAAAKELTKERKDFYKDADDEDIDDDFIEITREELEADPALMLDSSDALKAGAAPLGMTVTDYKARIQRIVNGEDTAAPAAGEADGAGEAEGEDAYGGYDPYADETADGTPADGSTGDAADENAAEQMSSLFTAALDAGAKALGTDSTTLSENLIWMKDRTALDAEMAATGLDEAALTGIINQAMVRTALSEDSSVDFDVEAFIWLNVGCCLLILAFSAIGFFASCVFNRSKNAMVIGAGLPFIFFLLNIMVQMSENLENFKYLTITTLFNTSEIVQMGEFGLGLAVLGAISVVLYTAGGVLFCHRDLPL